MALTGRFWFRRTWMGRLVLMVEVERRRWFGRGRPATRWRDASLLDLAEPSLRALLTLEATRRATDGATAARDLRPVPPSGVSDRARAPGDASRKS